MRYEFKNVKTIIINLIIIIGIGILTVWGLQEENLIGVVFAVIVTSNSFIFQNIIKNYKHKEHNKMNVLINIFTQCCIYIVIYGLILFVFKLEIILITKAVIIQIFISIYHSCRHYISETSDKKQVIFKILFFSIFLGMGVYGISAGMNTIDIIVYSTVLAVSASALFSFFIFIKSDDK